MSEKTTSDEMNWRLSPQTRTFMASIYNMSLKTFMKCIAPISHKLRYKEERRRFLTTREIGYIVDHMGEPEIIVGSKHHGENDRY